MTYASKQPTHISHWGYAMLKLHAQKFGDVSIICLSGGIVVSETANLRRVVQSQSDVNMVVLDFARVNRIDAGGLGVLLELRESLQTRNIAFRFMNVTTLIRQVF